MDYVRFGRTGLKVSKLCLGCMTYGDPAWRPWVLDEISSRPFIKEALDKGINFFDTADMYALGASERVVGKALKDMARRDEVVIATKVFNAMGPAPNSRGLSRKHIMEAIDGSLKRLGTDYVDLYQIHRFDPDTPIAETIDALSDVVKAGKARYLGASSMFAWQFMKMLGMQRNKGLQPFVSMQNFYNLIYREEEREMLPLCAAEGIAVMPWSPLARGLLAGSRFGKDGATTRAQTEDVAASMGLGTPRDYKIAEKVAAIAARRGVKPAVVAMAWVLSKKVVTTPIVGASKPHHLSDAIAAMTFKLSDAETSTLEGMYQPRNISGHR